MMGGGGGKGGGGMQMSSGDPVKDALVNRIKGFQRMGPEQKDLWHRYSDAYLGGKRDPGKHDTATLQEFVNNHNLPADPSSVPQVFDPAKAPLVDKVKTFQRMNPENKEIWSNFAGLTKDP